MLLTFGLTVFAWIFFRAENLPHAISYLAEIFSTSLFEPFNLKILEGATKTMLFIIIFVLIEWKGRENQYAISTLGLKWKKSYRVIFYYLLILIIMVFGNFENNEFIYFQF